MFGLFMLIGPIIPFTCSNNNNINKSNKTNKN